MNQRNANRKTASGALRMSFSDGIRHIMRAFREATAIDLPGAKREARLRTEALASGEDVDVLRSRIIETALNISEMERRVRADIVLVTTGNTECKQLEKAVKRRKLPWKKQTGRAATYFRLGQLKGQEVAAIKLEQMGSLNAEGSAYTCHRVRAETSATSFIAVGTAFGISDTRQQVGDVLVSNSLLLYDETNIIDSLESPGYLYQYDERALASSSDRWLTYFRKLKDNRWRSTANGTIQLGTLLAGSARIESRAFRDQLVQRVQSAGDFVIIGGEMEGPGLAAACRAPADWVVVKAISDFATAKSRITIKENRIAAAEAASNCVLDVLTQMEPTT